MEQLQIELAKLRQQLGKALDKLKIDKLEADLARLQQQMASPDFWQNNQVAQTASQQAAKLQSHIEPWQAFRRDLGDLEELANANDPTLALELTQQLKKLQTTFAKLKGNLLFSGPYDDHDAIVRLHAGAGGTDAQDWTEMLQRMYLRWADQNNVKTHIIEQSTGEEAGIKSATIGMSGPYVFGKLRGEQGVHRLVRLSPFNADHLRQTSFALVEVLPQIDTPDEVAIDDKDLKVDVFRAGGHGGQSVNTTDSAVRVTHVPTGITVAIQNERSQLQNKETALKILRSKLAQLRLEQHKEHIDELKGPTQSVEWGSQIRSYVLHPYTLVKDNRTKHEERDAQAVLDGKLNGFIEAYLESSQI